MTSDRSNRYRRRAFRHEARAHNYRRQADLLLQRDADFDCAGALLYEAAKQCINAVANQRGENPGTTGGKVNALRGIAASRARQSRFDAKTGKALTNYTFTQTAET